MTNRSEPIQFIARLVAALYRWRGVQPISDPVCGMAVDPRNAKHSAVYHGRTYYFCAPACRKSFAADPARFFAPGYVPSM